MKYRFVLRQTVNGGYWITQRRYFFIWRDIYSSLEIDAVKAREMFDRLVSGYRTKEIVIEEAEVKNERKN